MCNQNKTNGAWAYSALALNNEAYGVGAIYFVAPHFTTASVNPVTAAAYTEEEASAIASGAARGAEGYLFDVPEGAYAGMSVYGTDKVLWFDRQNAAAILKHADPLTLNAEAGEMRTADGTPVAVCMPKA